MIPQDHYIVDAYNLLFWCLKGENLERERTLLIHQVNAYVKRRNLNVTLVFDATWTEDPLAQSHYDALEIFFTDKGVTADDHIVHMVGEKDASHITVVTSDRGLSKRVTIRGAKAISTPAFYHWIKKTKVPKKETSLKKIAFEPAKRFIQEGSLAWYEKIFTDLSGTEEQKPT